MAEPEQRRPPQADGEGRDVTRRTFLRGVLIAAASIPVVASGCDLTAESPAPAVEPPPLPRALQYPEVPLPPDDIPISRLLQSLQPHEARTVEALTARLVPGTPEDPGAREAGVVWYIDNMLAFSEGFTEATYRQPPFAEVYEGENPPEDNPFEVVWVAGDQIERYGYQSILSPRETYRIGLRAVDQYAQKRFGSNFIALGEGDQDAIIQDMLDNKADTFGESFSSESFFHVLRRHTSEGMFSDPVYGGNQGMVGWMLVGYPGAQRAYTPQDVLTETQSFRQPQSLVHMSHFNPGQALEENVVFLPVSGSDLVREDPDESTLPHEHP
ncbi:MAG: gluconate 2-dehydrogenase subunit 3 family protein [Chloroflexi bacterium]|nr:gluconate 2-dehydrogenase subunit 3 family protein [Chloroflexota bacterium]